MKNPHIETLFENECTLCGSEERKAEVFHVDDFYGKPSRFTLQHSGQDFKLKLCTNCRPGFEDWWRNSLGTVNSATHTHTS
jgi:hypothetical protein